MPKQFIRNFIIVFLMLLIFSCKKEKSTNWDMDLCLPLIKTKLTIDNLIPDSLLQVNSDQSFSLVYRNPLYYFDLDSIITMPDTITSKYYPPYPGFVVAPGQLVLDITESQQYDFQGAKITQVDLLEGDIVVDFVNTIHEEVIITFKVPCATINGQYFQTTEVIPAATETPYHYLKSFDINGYTFDLTGLDHNSCNFISTSTKISLSPDAEPVTTTSEDEFNLLITFDNIKISYARGFFTQQEFSFGPSATEIDIFNGMNQGTLDLENINLSLYIENLFGIDATVNFQSINSINSYTGNTVPLNADIIGKDINISRGQETWDPDQPIIPSSYVINLDNSNIEEFVENLPDQINYSIDIITNPLGNVSSGNDFVYYDNYLNTFLDLEIPLSFKANNINLSDTIDFNLEKNEESNGTNGFGNGELLFIAYNGFPFSTEITLYSLNEKGTIIDTLIYNETILSGVINSSAIVESPYKSIIRIPISPDRIDLLYDTKKFVVFANFNTADANGQFLKLYNTYYLDLKVTAKLNYTYE